MFVVSKETRSHTQWKSHAPPPLMAFSVSIVSGCWNQVLISGRWQSWWCGEGEEEEEGEIVHLLTHAPLGGRVGKNRNSEQKLVSLRTAITSAVYITVVRFVSWILRTCVGTGTGTGTGTGRIELPTTDPRLPHRRWGGGLGCCGEGEGVRRSWDERMCFGSSGRGREAQNTFVSPRSSHCWTFPAAAETCFKPSVRADEGRWWGVWLSFYCQSKIFSSLSPAGGLVSTNSGLGASVTGTLDSSVTTVAGVSFVSVCSSGLSVTNVYLYRLTLKFCSGNRMGMGMGPT